jgi:hypothetical protein
VYTPCCTCTGTFICMYMYIIHLYHLIHRMPVTYTIGRRYLYYYHRYCCSALLCTSIMGLHFKKKKNKIYLVVFNCCSHKKNLKPPVAQHSATINKAPIMSKRSPNCSPRITITINCNTYLQFLFTTSLNIQ